VTPVTGTHPKEETLSKLRKFTTKLRKFTMLGAVVATMGLAATVTTQSGPPPSQSPTDSHSEARLISGAHTLTLPDGIYSDPVGWHELCPCPG
jgi:hypothetical protein